MRIMFTVAVGLYDSWDSCTYRLHVKVKVRVNVNVSVQAAIN